MKTRERNLEMQELVEDALFPLAVELENLENVLRAYEAGAYFCQENPKYDKPDPIILFRTLRRMRLELDEELNRVRCGLAEAISSATGRSARRVAS